MTVNGAPPSGTRDFFGDELRRRDAAVAVIREVFEAFAFEPLETPAFERLDLLTGKYGEDEKLIFKIAKRGAKAAEGEADLALRYDLTVPLARYVANRDFRREGPFRRYQIGPVWRADRPGRGRFREFFQCDVDILGSESPLADAETILAATEALHRLGLGRYVVRLNSRKVLSALMGEYGAAPGSEGDAIAAVDKLYKVGAGGVAAELAERGLPPPVIEAFEADQGAADTIAAVVERLSRTESGAAAYAEVRAVEDLVRAEIRGGEVMFDPFIARGLDYYTGPVFEVFYTEDPDAMPLSIASGGRYDDLLGMFGRGPVPACGASLGLERILLLLGDDHGERPSNPEVLVTVWDEESRSGALSVAMELREHGLSTEAYLGEGGLKAQLRYASRRQVRACVIAGPDERERGEVTVRDLVTGDQRTGPRRDVVELVRRSGS
jgi:histidyl-tRNA synthetase